MTLKPPFVYFGGKTVLAPKVAALLPAHGHYVEPFAGSLAVLLVKRSVTDGDHQRPGWGGRGVLADAQTGQPTSPASVH